MFINIAEKSVSFQNVEVGETQTNTDITEVPEAYFTG